MIDPFPKRDFGVFARGSMGPVCGNFGPIWHILAIFGHFWAFLGFLAIFGHFWPFLAIFDDF